MTALTRLQTTYSGYWTWFCTDWFFVFNYYHTSLSCRQEINKVLSQLQFGERHYSGIAYRGIEEASPKAVINQRGISQEDHCKFVLISIKYGFTYDERIVFRTQLDELCDVKLNCRKYKRCQVDRENLPVSSLSSEEEVGGVVLLKMEHQTVCEGILLSKFTSLSFLFINLKLINLHFSIFSLPILEQMCIVVSYLAASDHSCENIALKISSLK